MHIQKKWSKKDKEFLIENFGIISNDYIGEILDRTPESVQAMANYIGLRKGFKKAPKNKSEQKLGVF